MDKKIKYILISVAIVFAAIIIYSLWYLLTPRAHVVITLAPEEATLQYNKTIRTIKNGDEFNIAPGTYTFTFSRKEFSTETATVNVANGKTARVLVALTPLTDNAKAIIRNNPKSVSISEGYASQKASHAITKITTSNPALTKLPIAGRTYFNYACPSVKYPTDTTKQAICLDLASDFQKQAALDALTAAGIDISKQEILYGTSKTDKTILASDTYQITYNSLLKLDKPTLYIKPLITQAAGQSDSAYYQQLLVVKQAALDSLVANGYNATQYYINYDNSYLNQFNAPVKDDGDASVASPTP